MAKKKSWFGWVKKLFTCTEKTKRAKDWKWDLRRFEVRQYPALMPTRRTLCEAAEEQKKHALNVAIATAAAAEAAVAAAEAAAKVVRLTSASVSCNHFAKLDPNLAAIKIQTAYRAHLARKALRALKGLVRLQAIVRGRAVRRETYGNLRLLRSNSRRRPRFRERFNHTRDDDCLKDGENKTYLGPKKEFEEKELKLEESIQGEWNGSVLSKEDFETEWLKRQEATMKRERMMKYSFSQRERRNNSTFTLQDSLTKNESGSQSCRPQPWDGQETLKPLARSNLTRSFTREKTQAKQKSARRRESLEVVSTEFPLLRTSFSHEKWDLFGDDVLMPSSPALPTYMAATESAKAKTRSMSIPKQRVGFWDGCLDGNYPNKNRLSLWSSYDGESLWRS